LDKFNNLFGWFNSKLEFAYSAIRVFLGLALLIRGVVLFSNPHIITSLAGGHEDYWWYSLVMVAHIFGGLFLTVGFQARIASLVQLPILFGAVFFLHLKDGLASVGQSLELSTLVLFLLTIYFLFGAGPLSFDNKTKK
jgi:uncharacterized membrane protein YphA (DoxX/SURF4 family)